jgi:hypothetical protein
MVTHLPPETFMHRGERWTRQRQPYYESWVAGLDLGKSVDPTAFAVIQHVRKPLDTDWEVDKVKRTTTQRVDEVFAVRALQRFSLGMDYTEQATRVQELLSRPPLNRDTALVIDDAGVGAAVGDIFAKQIALEQRQLIRVTLTGTGLEVTRRKFNSYVVPKLLLISNLDARLHTGELRFAADLGEGEALRDELANFERHVTAAGRPTFEARSSKHDDLVLSIALALFWAGERRRLRYAGYHGPLKGLCC